jgi:chitodextrinase
VSASQVNLAWTASTDNIGVTGYRVFRNTTLITTVTGTLFSDTTVLSNTTYSYYVVAIDAAGNASSPSNTATATTPGVDTTPPTAPNNLTATAVNANQVNLAWTASIDNVGVTGYRVFRNTALITTVTGTLFSDTTVLSNTTYSYSTIAIDAAGNLSPQSNVATVTTPAANVVLTFTPTADAHVRVDQPTTNYGSSSTIQVDNAPVKHILLKFTVSGVGTRTIVSAKLRLYCVDASSFGGDFRRVLDTTWSEGTVTWNTAPVYDGNSLATLGAVTAGTWYEVDVTSLVTGDGTFSLKMLSTSTNGADYTSKEGAAGFAPQLVITTGAPAQPMLSSKNPASNLAAMATMTTSTVQPLLQAPNDQVPRPSTDLVATAVYAARVDLEWSPLADEIMVASFTIYQNGSVLATVDGGTFSYKDTRVGRATPYTYIVDAFDASGRRIARSNPIRVMTRGNRR